MQKQVKVITLILIFLSSTISGSVYHWYQTSTTSTQVLGEAKFGAPVSGATVSVLDQNGCFVARIEDATSPRGGFVVDIPWSIKSHGGPQDGFRLEVTGGTINGETFTGRLVKEVKGHTSESYHEVNLFTTLEAAYLERNPDAEQREAEERFGTLLMLSSDIDPSDEEGYYGYVDFGLIHMDAEVCGGYDQLFKGLVDDMESETPRMYVPFMNVGGAVTRTALNFIGKNIAAGAISGTASKGVGFLLDLVFDTNEEKSQEDLEKKLAEISGKLDEMDKTLEDLEKGQQSIIKQMEEMEKGIQSQFEDMKEALKDTVDQLKRVVEVESMYTRLINRRSTLVLDLNAPISEIKTGHVKLQRMSKANINNETLPKYQSLADQYISEILSIDGTECQLEVIHNDVVDYMGEKGILESWMALASLGASDEYPEDVYGMFESRYSYLLAAQFEGINLVEEAYYGKLGDETSQVDDFFLLSRGRIVQQLGVYERCVERFLISNIDDSTRNQFFTGNCEDEYSVMKMCDSFTGDIKEGVFNEEREGVVTVRVFNVPDVSGSSLPSKVQLKLVSCKNGKTFEPVSVERHDDAMFTSFKGGSESYEVLVLRYEVPYGSYSLAPEYSKYPELLRPYEYSEVHTVDKNHRFSSPCFVAYLSKLPVDLSHPSRISDTGLAQPLGAAANLHGELFVVVNDPFNEGLIKYDVSGAQVDGYGGSGFAPMAITVDDDGKIWVFDNGADRVVVFDRYLKVLSTVELSKFDSTLFASGISVYGDTVYLVNPLQGRIFSFEANDPGSTWFEHKPLAEIQKPSDVIQIDQDNVVICAMGDNTVRFLDVYRDRLYHDVGGKGSGEGEFNAPMGMDRDLDGNFYVVEQGNSRVQKFSPDWEFISVIGGRGSGEGQFINPSGVAVDGLGRVHVVDDYKRVQVYTECLPFFRGQ